MPRGRGLVRWNLLPQQHLIFALNIRFIASVPTIKHYSSHLFQVKKSINCKWHSDRFHSVIIIAYICIYVESVLSPFSGSTSKLMWSVYCYSCSHLFWFKKSNANDTLTNFIVQSLWHIFILLWSMYCHLVHTYSRLRSHSIANDTRTDFMV